MTIIIWNVKKKDGKSKKYSESFIFQNNDDFSYLLFEFYG